MNSDNKDRPNLEDTLAAGATLSTRIPLDSAKPTDLEKPSVIPNDSIRSAELDNLPAQTKKPTSDPPPELIEIPGYTFIDSLHESKRTIVFRAREEQSGRDVALKQFKDREQFDREREIQKLLTNSDSDRENLLLAYRFLDEQRTIISPYLRGGDLYNLLKVVGKLKPRQTWVIALDLLDGLQVMHNQGILHRDVKSRNVLSDITNPALKTITTETLESFVDLNFKLCDYEFALHKDLPEQHEEGKIIGTPRYLDPEVCLGGEYGRHSDIYGAGIIFYRLLAGCYPIDGENMLQIIQRQIRNSIPDITQSNSQITLGQKAVLEKSLAKKPKDRYQSAQEFKWSWIDELMRK
ncbi:MAG: serine/threonine-protein kinase [Nanoarchaeota archaeon]|nr:serine/threonine-protein kinase [Nanoarchaeota archaeon]